MARSAEALRNNPIEDDPPKSGLVTSAGADKAEVSGTFRVPDLRSVPPSPEAKKVMTELPAVEHDNETAQFVRREHRRQFGVELPSPSHEKVEVHTLTYLTEELETLLAKRSKLEADMKRRDSPIGKTVEALSKIGFLKDTVAAFSKWQAERADLESTLGSIDQLVQKTEAQIKKIVATRETRGEAQSAEIAKDAAPQDQQLIEKWFYNRSTEGGVASEEAQQEWEDIERTAMDREVISGIKGFDAKDQQQIAQWFEHPEAFQDDMTAELELMAKEGDLSPEEFIAWKKNEPPAATREAAETRVRELSQERKTLKAEHDALEDTMLKAVSKGKDSAPLWKEKIHFDPETRKQYLGGLVRRFFGKGENPADVFLKAEPRLRLFKAELAIKDEELRRARLVLKDFRRAVTEGAVRELGGVVALRKNKMRPGRESPASTGKAA